MTNRPNSTDPAVGTEIPRTALLASLLTQTFMNIRLFKG